MALALVGRPLGRHDLLAGDRAAPTVAPTPRRNIALPLEVGPCADVLAQEMRWLKAITAGDVATVESILGPTFRHVNSEGRLLNRAEEIATMEPLPFTMNPSEQIVDIAGDTAVIHGVNTLIAGRQGDCSRAIQRRVRVAERRMDGAVCAGDRPEAQSDAKLAAAANLPRSALSVCSLRFIQCRFIATLVGMESHAPSSRQSRVLIALLVVMSMTAAMTVLARETETAPAPQAGVNAGPDGKPAPFRSR